MGGADESDPWADLIRVSYAGKDPDDDAVKRSAERMVEAFNRADVDAFAAFYSDDAINHQVSKIRSKDMKPYGACLARLQRSHDGLLIDHHSKDGQWAILEWRDPLGFRGCGFFHIRERKIVSQRGY
jgi:hypothetical protein